MSCKFKSGKFTSIQSKLFDLGTLCALIGPEGQCVDVWMGKVHWIWFQNRFLRIKIVSYTVLLFAAPYGSLSLHFNWCQMLRSTPGSLGGGWAQECVWEL